MNDKIFSFPCDEGKTPLISVTTARSIKDYNEILLNIIFKSESRKIFVLVCLVIFSSIFIMSAISFMLAKQFYGALIRLAVALVPLLFPLYMKLKADKMSRLIPNKSSFFTYTFYKHHFNFICEYSASSTSYDDILYASENAMGITLKTSLGTYHYIAKTGMNSEDAMLLRNVLINKLGSKYIVHVI